MRDTVALLAVGVVAVAFVAFELGAERGMPWHTISWYSQHRKWLRILIGLGLPIAFALWFLWHTRLGAPILT